MPKFGYQELYEQVEKQNKESNPTLVPDISDICTGDNIFDRVPVRLLSSSDE